VRKGSPATAQRIDIPALNIRADLRAESVDAEARTVEVIFSTGAPVQRYDWMSDTKYIETLSMKPGAVRLERLNNGAPFLDTHNAYEIDSILGVVVPGSARLVGGQARAIIRFSKREEVDPVWQDVVDGIVRNVSVGYRVHKYEQTEGDGKIPTRLAIDWEPYEISAVPMGADDGAKVRAQDMTPTNPCVIVTRTAEESHPMPETTPAPDAPRAIGDPAEIEVRNPTDPGAPTAPSATPAERHVAQTERQAGVVDERGRVEGIMRAVTSVNLPVEMASRLIRDAVSLQDAQAAVIAEVSRRGNQEQGPRFPGVGGVEVTRDANSHVRAGIENALLHRIKPDWFKLDDLGKLYANRRMIGLAECWLQSCGLRTTGMGNLDIAGVALGLNMRAGLHTTSDFANILADAMGKTLRRAYEEAPQTFGPITSRADLVDFKPVKRTQLSEAPTLDLVNEHGEFTSGTMGDAKEQYQLSTYGKTFGITRQALVNDDLAAFTNLAIKFGRSARQKESDLVWLQITGNPTMGDGVALFHATHANLSASSDAIAIAAIGAAWAAMGLQKGLTGVELLNITPAYLIVPKAKETIAKQFVSTNLMAAQSSNVNPFAGVLTVIAEPRLDAASGVSWYLAAPVAQVDIIELGFLAGEAGPMVESQIGFKVDGIEVKCRHDVAAKVIDWRGLYKNPGA
jgi:hypothetical protein